MIDDHNQSKEALLRKLNAARYDADQAQERVRQLEARLAAMQRRCQIQTDKIDHECAQRDETEKALYMAQLIIDRSPVILFRRLAGDDPKLVYVSSNISQFGYAVEAFLNGQMQFKDIVHPEDSERLAEEIQHYVEADVEEYTQLYRIVTREGQARWVEDQTSVVRDAAGKKLYHQGIVVDITQRKLAEDELRRSEEKFRRIVETTGEGFVMMNENLTIIDVNEAYCRMLGFRRDEILGKSPYDLGTDAFRQFLTAHRERLLAMDYRKFEGSLVASDGRTVPVLIHGNTLRDDRGRILGNIAFVADLTEQKKALNLAGRVQRSLVPGQPPAISGLDIAGRSDACDEVGGDYFDFLYGPEFSAEKLRVVVGDIAGHGVDAALLMTAARAFIRTRAAQAGSPSQMVTWMNRDLTLDMADTGHFMTMFFMEIDPRHGSAVWVRAGHEPALIYHPGHDDFQELVGSGLPLGIDMDFAYPEYRLPRLAAGTLIALGTDGIWESFDANGRPFGKDRFRQILREAARAPAAEIVANVFDARRHFTRGVPSEDDVTLVIIKVLAED